MFYNPRQYVYYDRDSHLSHLNPPPPACVKVLLLHIATACRPVHPTFQYFGDGDIHKTARYQGVVAQARRQAGLLHGDVFGKQSVNLRAPFNGARGEMV